MTQLFEPSDQDQETGGEYLPEVKLTKKQNEQMEKLLKHSRFMRSNRDSFMHTESIKNRHEDLNLNVAVKYGLTNTIEAVAIIGIFCQLGGTSAGCDGNLIAKLDVMERPENLRESKPS